MKDIWWGDRDILYREIPVMPTTTTVTHRARRRNLRHEQFRVVTGRQVSAHTGPPPREKREVWRLWRISSVCLQTHTGEDTTITPPGAGDEGDPAAGMWPLTEFYILISCWCPGSRRSRACGEERRGVRISLGLRWSLLYWRGTGD